MPNFFKNKTRNTALIIHKIRNYKGKTYPKERSSRILCLFTILSCSLRSFLIFAKIGPRKQTQTRLEITGITFMWIKLCMCLKIHVFCGANTLISKNNWRQIYS